MIIQAESLKRLVNAILKSGGSSDDEAQVVAEHLVRSNLAGHDSHGVGMIPRYISCVLTGALQPNAHAKMVVDSGALVVMDGQAGFGQVIGGEIMDVGMDQGPEKDPRKE